MKRFAALCLAGLAFALPASAQSDCSSLSIQTSVDPVRPFQTVTIAVDGTPANASVYLAVGPDLGETRVDLRSIGVLVLGLDRPFTTTLLGSADANGSLSRSVTIPSDLGLTLNAQSVAIGIVRNPGGRPKIEFCTSNVVTFDL